MSVKKMTLTMTNQETAKDQIQQTSRIQIFYAISKAAQEACPTGGAWLPLANGHGFTVIPGAYQFRPSRRTKAR